MMKTPNFLKERREPKKKFMQQRKRYILIVKGDVGFFSGVDESKIYLQINYFPIFVWYRKKT